MRISDWSSDVCSSDLIKTAEAFFAAVPARVSHGGDRAFYAPGPDRIPLPPFSAFHEAHGYYATRSHETVHWTRHKSRLDRSFGRDRKSDAEGKSVRVRVHIAAARFLKKQKASSTL